MTLPFEISNTAQVYLQPTGWCAPNYDAPETWYQVAGLPVWANAVRVVVRDYGKRSVDSTLPLSYIPALLKDSKRPDIAAQWSAICNSRAPWSMPSHQVSFTQTRLMGVLNATPDSFSDGGDNFDPKLAIVAAQRMAVEGADIIDIGGESTRPGAKIVWEGEEIERVSPVIGGCNAIGVPISLDTRKAAVMEHGLSVGAHIINDVSALSFDEASLTLMASQDCPIVLMHARGDPQTMQHAPRYDDVVLDVYDQLADRIQACLAAGIDRDRLCIDPGIGFGKSLQHNLALINNLSMFHSLGCPVLLGVSRKRFIGALSGEDDAKNRLPGSLSAAQVGLAQGVHILRVHDVMATRQMLDVWGGLRDEQQMPNASLLAN